VNESSRLSGLRARLVDEGVSAAVLAHVPNIAYCTGFEGVFDAEPAHLAIVTEDDALLYTDSRYVEALTSAAEGGPWNVRMPAGDLTEAVCTDLATAGVDRVSLEDTVPHARFLRFADRFAGEVVPSAGWVELLRTVKDEDEISRIVAAQELTDRAFEHVLGVIRRGVTERDVALELEMFMRREGSEGVAFSPIVAGGLNSALPHANVTDRVLEEGDFLVLDFGARVGGYCADMTRTVVVGHASQRHREVYDTVLAASRAGIAAVRGGVTGADMDAAARAVIVERGFGEYFGHGLGHGVGLEVHELPGVGPRSGAAIPTGSVITIEPGVYLPGFGGARIEDLTVVEEAGARVLTRSTKDLLEL
jgi:Xaa-Pro aminopeptidase